MDFAWGLPALEGGTDRLYVTPGEAEVLEAIYGAAWVARECIIVEREECQRRA